MTGGARRSSHRFPVRNEFAVRIRSHVVVGPNRMAVRQAHVANAVIPRNQIGYGIVTVIEDEQFAVGVILAQEILDGLWNQAVPIGCSA